MRYSIPQSPFLNGQRRRLMDPRAAAACPELVYYILNSARWQEKCLTTLGQAFFAGWKGWKYEKEKTIMS
jgi:hypothetical protein